MKTSCTKDLCSVLCRHRVSCVLSWHVVYEATSTRAGKLVGYLCRALVGVAMGSSCCVRVRWWASSLRVCRSPFPALDSLHLCMPNPDVCCKEAQCLATASPCVLQRDAMVRNT